MSRLIITAIIAALGAQLLSAQVSQTRVEPYELKVETQPGVVIVTFSTASGQARAYLPDDLAPGEPFSGSMESNHDFLLDFAGENTETRSNTFHWTVPAVQAGDFVPLLLRNLKGQELARAPIQINAKSSAAQTDLRVPKLVQAGKLFPILGSFDGNSASTTVVIQGKGERVVAESRRKTVVRAPGSTLGVVPYRIVKKSLDQSGEMRVLAITLTDPAGGGTSELSVRGLNGIDRDVPLSIARNFFYLRPDDISADGTFTIRRIFDGVRAGSSAESAELVVPQSPEDEVGVILRTPQRERTRNLAAQHADAMRLLDFDALPAAAAFLTDFDIGSDAAYAMLALDEPRALSLLLGSMPQSGPNIERLGMTWFLDHYDFAAGSRNASEAHSAALRLLNTSAGSSTVVTELALYILGLTGSPKDFPLLERYYTTESRLSGLKGTRDASEAALARLGSRDHIQNIRAELAAHLPAEANLQQGLRMVQSLEKAGYSGKPELIPQVCTHISDPVVLEIDVSTNPGQRAIQALSAIVDKTSPRAASTMRTPADWAAFCAQNAER